MNVVSEFAQKKTNNAMSENGGFTDLRIGHGAQGVGDDSVWPSFTDVMTVIVMIFLMALVVIMVRNFELNRQLAFTTSASEELAKAKFESDTSLANTKNTLEQTLTDLSQTQGERNELQIRLEQELKRIFALSLDQEKLEAELGKLIVLREELENANNTLIAEGQGQKLEIETLRANEQLLTAKISQLSEKLSNLELESSSEITSLTQEKQTLGQKLDTVSNQLAQIRFLLNETELKNLDLSAEIKNLTELKKQAEENYTIAEEEIQALKNLIILREAENRELKAESSTTLAGFNSLQQEYDSLNEEYRKLIRAARSTAGKVVVEIWVEKPDGEFVYRIKEPADDAAKAIALADMHQKLTELKASHGPALYTKIIIPESSNLTHNEAWEFTQNILNQYDYYYQPQ